MDLDEFAWNPFIDELIWVRESLGVVSKIIPVVAGNSDTGVLFVGRSSFEHFYPQEPGWFAEFWSDAAEVLEREGLIEPLRKLDDSERDLLRPAEEQARQWEQARLTEREREKVARLILEAREKFWRKQYDRVVSIFTECESALGQSDIRKLHYARRRTSADLKTKKS